MKTEKTVHNRIAKHSNLYNVVMGFILKVSQVLFPLITFPYVSRILLADGVGRVNFVQSTVSIFSTLAMLGIPVYGIKVCAKVRDNKVKLATTVRELLLINTISVIISYIALVLCVIFLDRLNSDIVLFSVMSVTIAFTAFGAEWFYQAIEQYDYITIRSVVAKFVSVALMFFVVKDRNDVVQYGVVMVVGTVGSNILNIIRLHKFIKFHDADNMNLRQHMKPILTLFAFSAATTVYSSLDTSILGFLKNDTEVGYYAAAMKIKNLLTQIVTVVSSVLMPRTAYLLEQGRKANFLSLIKNSLSFNVVIALPLMAICIVNAEPIIVLLSGEPFLPSVPVMQISILSIIFIGMTNVIGLQMMIPLDMENKVFHSTLVGAVVNICLNLLMIPLFGAIGSAIAVTCTEMVVFIVQAVLIRNYVSTIFDCVDILKAVVSVALASVLAVIVNELLNGFWTSLIFSSILLGGSYLVLLIVLGEHSIRMVVGGDFE